MTHRLVVLVALLAAGCSGPPADPGAGAPPARVEQSAPAPEMGPAEKRAEINRKLVAGLPKDAETLAMVAEAGRYFSEPKFTWSNCETTARRLNEQGMAADPREILSGFLRVMKGLGIEPNGRRNDREYFSIYEDMRARSLIGSEVRRASHAEVVDLMIARQKFAPVP